MGSGKSRKMRRNSAIKDRADANRPAGSGASSRRTISAAGGGTAWFTAMGSGGGASRSSRATASPEADVSLVAAYGNRPVKNW